MALWPPWEVIMSDRSGRAFVAVALFAIAASVVVGSVRLLMTLEVLR
jgi:hypothetical protein